MAKCPHRLSAEDIEALVERLRKIFHEAARDAADCIESLRTEIDATLKRAKASEAEARNLQSAGVRLFDQLAAANARADAAEALVRSMQEGTAVVLDGFQARYDAAVQALEEIASYSILPFSMESGVSLNVTAAKLVYDAWAQSVQIARLALAQDGEPQ